MNERIKQLSKQAGINLTPAQFSGVLEDEVDEFTLEKFAELIVQECMRQVEEQYKPVLEDTEMMKDTHWDGYVQCGVDSYVAIREHFYGVEE
jgi:hypothetical protein